MRTNVPRARCDAMSGDAKAAASPTPALSPDNKRRRVGAGGGKCYTRDVASVAAGSAVLAGGGTTAPRPSSSAASADASAAPGGLPW